MDAIDRKKIPRQRRLAPHELELWEHVTRHVNPLPGKAIPRPAVSSRAWSRLDTSFGAISADMLNLAFSQVTCLAGRATEHRQSYLAAGTPRSWRPTVA